MIAATTEGTHVRTSKPRASLRPLVISVALYVILFAVKLAAYAVTGVLALLGEALHTLSDVFIFGFLLLAAIYARKAADETHMFGYGRAENVAALVAATLFISFTSFQLYSEAIPALFREAAVSYQYLELALGVILVSMVLVAAPMVQLLRQTGRGAAARAQLLGLLNDELGLLAALVGTLFIVWGQTLADPIATLVVATIIAVDAVILFRENASFLLGRSPGDAYLAQLEQAARSVPGVRGVHEVRAEYVGPETVHAGLHIEVARDLSIEAAHRIAQTVRQRVHDDTNAGYCVIEVEPLAAESKPA